MNGHNRCIWRFSMFNHLSWHSLILSGALWQESLLVQERRGCWNVSCEEHALRCRAFLWSLTTSFAASSDVEFTLRPLTIHPTFSGSQHGNSFAGFSNFDLLATLGFLAEIAEDSLGTISCSQRSCWEAETSAGYISTDVCIDPTCICTPSTRSRILDTRGAFGRLPWGSSVGSCWRQSRETWLLGKGGRFVALPRCHGCVGSNRRAFRMDMFGEWRWPSCGSERWGGLWQMVTWVDHASKGWWVQSNSKVDEFGSRSLLFPARCPWHLFLQIPVCWCHSHPCFVDSLS